MRVIMFAVAVSLCFSVRAVESCTPLIFWDARDIVDPFGDIRFGAEPLENEGKATGYPGMQC